MLSDRAIGFIQLCARTNSARRITVFLVAFIMALSVMGGMITEGVKSIVFIAEAKTVEDSKEDVPEKTEAELEAEQVAEMIAAAKLSTMTSEQRQKVEERQRQEKVAREAAEEDIRKAKEKAAAKEKEEAEKAEEEKSESKKGTDGFVYSQNIPLSYQLQEYTYKKCVERGLEYELVLAVMWRESRFNVNAVNVNSNGTRDNGLMQINDCNKNWLRQKYGINNLMDPYQNIDAGTAMLGELTAKYGSHKAMMAYQYGEGGMVRQLNQGRNTSTAIEAAYRQRDYYRSMI